MVWAEQLATNIAQWLRDYADGAGARGYLLGLSGGIDSTVAAALCKQAVGDRVLGVLMPIHSLAEDAEMARLVAGALDIETVTVDLGPVFDATVAAMPFELGDMAEANVKPRLRMTALYALAQTRGYLVVGTGNKSERMVGYFTKYGDGGADVAPLGDLYKHEVRAVARVLGVPLPVIDRPPSAGLWQGQTDEGEMGMTYDDLDRTLEAMETGNTSDVDPQLLAQIQARIAATEHKRNLPPIYYK
ncbi:MAG: NAD(+) synthase [Anaerolineae bacterium]|nr:NAD(+) synthase [Anaerolineae bacterium]